MNKQGQHNYKGINAQAWAAMSLFLQYLRDPNFLYIQLEAPKFQDFNLVFKDEHKIICESKAWKKEFSFPQLKKIIKNILDKNTFGEKDEILIICKNLNKELENKIKYIKYWSDKLAPEFKKRKFTDQQIAILDKVKFWKIQEINNHFIVYSLFGELLDFWLPEDELECKADSILLKKIYEGSAKGEIYRRNDILNQIISMRNNAIKYCGYFDNERVKTEQQLQNIIEAVNDNKSPIWADNQLSALTTKPSLMFFTLDQLKNKKIDNLLDWDKIWNLYKIFRFSFSLFKIFEYNLHTKKNKDYILTFFNNNIGEFTKFYQEDFFNSDIIDITKKILEKDKDNKYIDNLLAIVKKMVIERKNDIFYLERRKDNSWERTKIAELLQEIYQKANPELKKNIFYLTVNSYNLIKDEGKFSNYTPNIIFNILENWLTVDFKKRLHIINKILRDQYDQFYKRFSNKTKFNGWELMGSGISFSGNYHISDRHFVLYILTPAINKFYKQDKNKGWEFIKKHCITKSEDISKDKPDFLNRSVFRIILERYAESNSKVSNEAFTILSEFILSRKGIPHKSDLIYQALIGFNVSDNKKLKLVKVSINKYKIPVNVFVEQIISSLVKKKNKEAKEILISWFNNPKYLERIRFDSNVIQNIKDAIEADFNFGIGLFNSFIDSDFFINQYDSFDVYEFAKILHNILLNKKSSIGKEIINKLISEKELTKNQQILLGHSLLGHPNDQKKDSHVDILNLYNNFVKPLFDSLNNDINEINKKIWHSNAREVFVEFAEKLAIIKEIGKALSIVKIFINDPDPFLPNKNPEDKKDEFCEQKRIENGEVPMTITSVRGWCGWVLMKCSVRAGRDHLEEIMGLTDKLTKDKNWYVKHMSCFALSQLAQNRLTVLDDNRKILFFGKDKKEALSRARKIETTAFKLLEEISNASVNVKKALAKSILTVFGHIRALGEFDVIKFIRLLKKFPNDAIVEAEPVLIFFAEFRKEAFVDWEWELPELYDYLKPNQYNNEKVRKEVFKIIDELKPEERFSFGASCERMIRENNPKSQDAKKYFTIAYKYLNYISKEYNEKTFSIIYETIQEAMQKNWQFDKWLILYTKCLKIEQKFYADNFQLNKASQMYWWPYHENFKILELIYNQGKKDKFLETFNIIINFPKEFNINESDNAILLLKKYPKTDKRIKIIIDKLFTRNPGKYYNLKKEFNNNDK